MITSPRNPRVAAVIKLHRKRGRSARGRTILEGPHLLEEAVAAGAAIDTVFGLAGDGASERSAREAGAAWVAVDEAVLRRLSTTGEPQSPVAVVAVPAAHLPERGHLLAAWGVGDPGNTGTLIRAAAAFGFGFAAGPGTADLWSPKVLRSASGAHWRTAVGLADDLEALRGAERALVATVVAGGDPPEALHGVPAVAVVVGAEAHGLPGDVVEHADLQITIPMPGGTESLNAAVAGAILAYEVSRGGSGGDPAGD